MMVEKRLGKNRKGTTRYTGVALRKEYNYVVSLPVPRFFPSATVAEGVVFQAIFMSAKPPKPPLFNRPISHQGII